MLTVNIVNKSHTVGFATVEEPLSVKATVLPGLPVPVLLSNSNTALQE